MAINEVEVRDFPVFTQEDFMNTTAPYEYVYKYKDNGFLQSQIIEKVSFNASAVKFRNFKATYKKYVDDIERSGALYMEDNTTQFEGQELELNCGKWHADDFGITIYGGQQLGEVLACAHPLSVTLRLVNIDTGEEKLKLVYRKGKQWRSLIVDKKTLASANSIISLASYGISVNSENAKFLIRYLHDLENFNYDYIPEKNSVSHLGWIDNNNFAPYVEDLVFDGDINYKNYFESVSEHGKYTLWLDTARQVRQGDISSRMILAGSFASVLVKPLGCLPFFIHLWGGTEVGKTVGLMLAASVWANPDVGYFIHTFNSTAVGRERSAAFVNSLPLILDELQIMKDRKEFDKIIYMLSEGVGRSRGNKSGGMDKTPTWHNCILTNGEMPITSSSSGGGAVNRIIEIECLNRLFDNPRDVANTVKKNYGFAGKIFVKQLQQDGNIQKAESLFNEFYKQLSKSDTTEKQAMAAALILTADQLATDWIFHDNKAMTTDEIAQFLQSKAAVSVNSRAYDYLCEYVIQNKSRFCGDSQDFEVWGKVDKNQVFIVRREFDRICQDQNFSSRSLLSWLKQNKKIEIPERGFTKSKRINGLPCHCVILNLGEIDKINPDDFELIGEIE